MDIGQGLLWAYVIFYVVYCMVVLTGAFLSLRRISKAAPTPVLSLGIVVPAFNELGHIESIALSIAAARSMQVPIVIVDDGSSDGSETALDHLCGAGQALLIRHERNRGKTAALNSGVAALETELVLTLDADTTLSVAAILEAAAAFAVPQTGAVALTIEGSGASVLARMQMIEYRFVMNFERQALACLGITFTVPGSASVWRRRALTEIGGFKSRTCAEDTDATISLSLAGWRVAVASSARAVTDCPHSIGSLLQQRSRWIWGTIQAAFFALAALVLHPARHHLATASAFLAVTGLNIFGFLVGAHAVARFASGDLGWMDVVAAATFFAMTIIRLVVVCCLQPSRSAAIPAVLLSLMTMQMINSAAFWYGFVTGRAGRFSW